MSQTADIDTSGLRRCSGTLEAASEPLQCEHADETMRDIFRAACVKEFELVLEIGGSLLRKRLRDFFTSNREADRLTFRNAFRHAAKHGLVSAEGSERWLQYRDIRNASAHDYGEHFAETALELLPAFIADAQALANAVESASDG